MAPAIFNHLWQSTIFAVVAGLLSLALRQNHARTRHWIWIAASVNFLIPFSLLISAGSHLQRARAMPAVPARLPVALAQISQPFASPVPFGAVPVKPHATPFLLPVVWFCGFAGVVCFWFARWRRMRTLVRGASPIELALPCRAMSSPSLMEPGVFGVFQPVLLLPEGIHERLAPEQLHAVIVHELCHIRRRDNLLSAIHMVVEALFWFHPLVWWIGARLVAERERACDEEVLGQGSEPQAYAEGILNVCKLYLESPLTCVSGVTGSDLRERIEAIMTTRIAVSLSMGKKLLLAAATVAALVSPIVIGLIHAQVTGPAFEVASVKANNSDAPRFVGWQSQPGGTLSIKNQLLGMIIAGAYGLPMFNNADRLAAAPKWIDQEKFDIEAKAPAGVITPGMPEKDRNQKMARMLQALLAERFKLAIHRETREMPVYGLTVTKGGLKLPAAKMAEKDCPEISTREKNCHSLSGGQGGGIQGNTVTMAELVEFLQVWTDRPVIDKTGAADLYDVDIRQGWVPMRPRPVRPPGQEPTAEDIAFADPTRPTLNAVLDKVGLKLEPSRGSVEVIVIDHIEHPSEN
ncbi:MAG TPA: M56 family metallopeptidase [Bryobacteraceae bacterium]|nr:M56 family metallopeptidase [Bryobacteraceae bacterium]